MFKKRFNNVVPNIFLTFLYSVIKMFLKHYLNNDISECLKNVLIILFQMFFQRSYIILYKCF